MATWHQFALTFDPPATTDQLSALHRWGNLKDSDWPESAIHPEGTRRDSCWREPMVSEEQLCCALTAFGIHGHGWRFEVSGTRSAWDDPHHGDRFTFGTVPDSVATVLNSVAALEPNDRALICLMLEFAEQKDHE